MNISEIINMLEKLPLNLIYEVSAGTFAPQGYGAYRQYFVRIISVYDECQKCGYNTLTPDETLNDKPFHRHSWKEKEKTLAFIPIRNIEEEEKAKEVIIKYLKTYEQQRQFRKLRIAE